MAFRRQIACYVCTNPFVPQRLAFLNGEENATKREIAITRRNQLGHPPLDITNDSRICLNCNVSIINEIAQIEADPTCIRLNILTQTARQSCFICNAENNIHRLSIECRVQIFIQRNIYIPEGTRSCQHHLDEKNFLLDILLLGLRFVNRPYILKGPELNAFLQQLRNVGLNKTRCLDENNLTDAEFECIAPITKEQFEDLFSFCDPVLLHGKIRKVYKKDLLTFLCKLRQGLSDDFLKVIFDYRSRQTVSTVIDYVRLSLMVTFVPANIGPGS